MKATIKQLAPWVLGAAIALAGIPWCWSVMRTAVRASHERHPIPVGTSASALLNHANTYYWFGRYRKNTRPEFERAMALAQQARTKALAAVPPDTALVTQADALLEMGRQQLALCDRGMGSHYPFHMELMDHVGAFVEQDCAPEEFPQQAVIRAMDQLLGVMCPDRTVLIRDRALYALVVTPPGEPEVNELVTEKLNADSRLYTIAAHEAARILGREVTDIASLAGDTIALRALCSGFNADQLALVHLLRNDRVDGIHYHGLRFDLWSPRTARVEHTVYTESFLQDRTFNQMPGLKLPLLIVFLLLALAMNLVITGLQRASGVQHAVQPYHMIACFLVGVVANILAVDVALVRWLNPEPQAYYAEDLGEVWAYALPVVMLFLPALVAYLTLGKLDNLIPQFRSGLDQRASLFSWCLGSLLVFPFVWTYYCIMRSGWSPAVGLWLPVAGALSLSAWLISGHWKRVLELPERAGLLVRGATYGAIALHALVLYLAVLGTLMQYDASTLTGIGITLYLPGLLVAEGVGLAGRRGRVRAAVRVGGLPHVLPDHIDTLLLGCDAQGWRVALEGALGGALQVNGRRGMDGHAVVRHALREHPDVRVLHVDLEAVRPKEVDVHYYPFAEGLAGVVAWTAFNDVAETARKAGNLIGRLLNGITSVGGLLVDEGGTRARKPEEAARIIAPRLAEVPTVLVVDHTDRIDAPCRELLQALTAALMAMDPAKRPLLVTCSYATSAGTEAVDSLLEPFAPVTFTLHYTDLAHRFLESEDNRRLPIMARVHLASLLQREEKDLAPEPLEAVFADLRATKAITDGSPFQVVLLDRLDGMKDIEPRTDTEQVLRDDPELRRVLTAAAYASDGLGRFRITLVARMVGLERMPLLFILKRAEEHNLVVDLKGDAQHDRYAFTDRHALLELKEPENAHADRLSQLAREYYSMYVRFHVPGVDIDAELQRLEGDLQRGQLHATELFNLAQRAMRVHADMPADAEHICRFAARMLSSAAHARLDDALTCMDNADAIQRYRRDRGESLDAQESLRADLLRWSILVEQGNAGSADARRIAQRFRTEGAPQGTSDAAKLDLLLLEARYCFLDFNPDNRSRGEACCDRVMEAGDALQRARARFYRLKLVSNVDVDLSRPTTDPAKAMAHDQAYVALLAEVRALPSGAAARRLLGEVLNDLGGLLGDRFLGGVRRKPDAPGYKELAPSGADGLFARINELLTERVRIEVQGSGPLDERSWERLITGDGMASDRRGLCYTLNYWTRALGVMDRLEEARAMGARAYRLNRNVGDHLGASIAAGTLSDLYDRSGDPAKAFTWQEQSHGHAWFLSDDWRRRNAAWRMLELAQASGRADLQAVAHYYARQYELLHALRHLPAGAKAAQLSERLFLKRSSVQEQLAIAGSRFVADFPDPEVLRSWARAALQLHVAGLQSGLQLQYRDAGGPIPAAQIRVEDVRTEGRACVVVFTADLRLSENSGCSWYAAGIGTDHLVQLDDMLRAKIRQAEGRPVGISAVPVRELSFTHLLQVVVRCIPEKDLWMLDTAFPGTYAPPFPTPGLDATTRERSEAFWAAHAFGLLGG
jgi:hypothetical protein